MEVNENVLTTEECFNYWVANTKKAYEGSRYLFQNRYEILDDLISVFKQNKMSVEDLRIYKNRVVNVLVTREGFKGQGKYKGWKETVSADFDAVLVDYFIPEENKEVVKVKEANDGSPLSIIKEPLDQPVIEAWGRYKFGLLWSDKMKEEANTLGSPLFNMFFSEVMDSEWIRTGKDMPKWAEIIFSE